MTTLITGGAGYIGSHVAYELTDRGEEVVIMDNLSTGVLKNVPPLVPLVKMDVGYIDEVSQMIDRYHVDTIMHFAGSVVVPESVRDPLTYYRNNTLNSWRLIQTAVSMNIQHFIFSSTAAVYGSASGKVNETDALLPASPYGRSKLMTEMMLRDAYTAYGLRYGILRYFNVAGADPLGRTGQSTPNATHLIKAAVQTALGKRPCLDIYGTDYDTPDGTCIRDYIHVTDLARAHVEVLNTLRDGATPTTKKMTANCGYGVGYSVREVVAMVKKVSGVDFPIREVNRRPGDIAEVVCNPARLRRQTAWMPLYDDLELIVTHAYNWEVGLDRA